MILIDLTPIHWPGANRYLENLIGYLKCHNYLSSSNAIRRIKFICHNNDIYLLAKFDIKHNDIIVVPESILPKLVMRIVFIFYLSLWLKASDKLVLNSCNFIVKPRCCVVKVWHSSLHLTSHTFDYAFKKPKRFLRLALEHLIDAISSLYISLNIFPSHFIEELAQKRFSIRKQKSRVIYHDVSFLQAETKSIESSAITTESIKYIVYISSIDFYKNHLKIIDLFGKINDPSFFLIFIGPIVDINLQKTIQKKATDVNLNISFTGKIDRAQVSKYLDKCFASLAFSSCETFGFPLVESMSKGLPIIATNTGNNREILSDSGLYIQSSDELKYILDKLLYDDNFYKSSCLNSLERYKTFRRLRTYDRLVRLLLDDL